MWRFCFFLFISFSNWQKTAANCKLHEAKCKELKLGVWVINATRCISRQTAGVGWESSQGICEERAPTGWRGQLVRIDSDEVAAAVKSITDFSGRYWVGGKLARGSGSVWTDYDWMNPITGQSAALPPALPTSVIFEYLAVANPCLSYRHREKGKLKSKDCGDSLGGIVCEFVETCDCGLFGMNCNVANINCEHEKNPVINMVKQHFHKETNNIINAYRGTSVAVGNDDPLMCGSPCKSHICCLGFEYNQGSRTCGLIFQGKNRTIEDLQSIQVWLKDDPICQLQMNAGSSNLLPMNDRVFYASENACFMSKNKKHILRFENNGELALYKIPDWTTTRWTAGTANDGHVLKFQADGAVAIYDINLNSIWDTGTGGTVNVWFWLRNNGNFGLYKFATQVWGSNTAEP